MNNEKILETFVEENIGIAEKILGQLKELEAEVSEQKCYELLENLKIIKSNAHIMDFVWLEKICNGFEEVIIAVLTKNLIYSVIISSFLNELVQQVKRHIYNIKSGGQENSDNLEKWIIDCDRIAAGMILEIKSKDGAEADFIPEQKNVVISSERLNEMLATLDEVSLQQSRLKQQSIALTEYDESCGVEFSRLRKNLSSTIKDMEILINEIQNQLLESGMVKLSKTLSEFQIRYLNDKCKIDVEDTDIVMDKMLAPHLAKILNLFLQNSKDYGFKNILNPKVSVSTKKNGDLIELTFKDNGNGINFEELRQNIINTFPQRKKEVLEMDENSLGMFLFSTGMTPAETGLNNAWKEIEKIKGKLKIYSQVGEGTSFTLDFPKTLTSDAGFTIKYGNYKFFIPANYVVESVSKTDKELITDAAKPYFEHRNQKINIYRLSSILPDNESVSSDSKQGVNQILIIEYLELRFGLIVDNVLSFSNKTVKPVPEQLKGVEEVEGIVIDENYDIIPVLNVPSLIKRFTWLRDYDLKRTEVAARKTVKNILVVDPSTFARHIIRSIYENKGFFVEEAKDGIEALEILKEKDISLVISAVEMPRMNGLTLLDNIKRNQNEKEIPVILFPFEADEEAEKYYLEQGAKFVIRKNDFDRNKLLEESCGL